MDFVVWKARAVGNACTLEPIENVERFPDLYCGVSFAGRFPADATFRMSRSFKKDTRLVDDVINGSSVKVCSKRLTDFLRAQKLPHVEYLPVTILNHKGRVASTEYTVVNPVGLQDALDLKASGPHYNLIDKQSIDHVDKIVLAPARLEKGVRLFRLKGLTTPVLLDKALADAIAGEGFVGPYFQPPDSVRK